MPTSKTLKTIDRALDKAERKFQQGYGKMQQGREELLIALEDFAAYAGKMAKKARERKEKPHGKTKTKS